MMFQHTAARRRLEFEYLSFGIKLEFQHTAARRRLVHMAPVLEQDIQFQHTAARRRLVVYPTPDYEPILVSTHSRPKAAGGIVGIDPLIGRVSTHSRLKAAGGAFPICEKLQEFQHTAA